MSNTAVNDLIERGVESLRAQRLEEAVTLLRQALAEAPDNAEASSLCGVALLRGGQAAEAEPLLARAVALEPEEPGYRVNLAELLSATGRHDSAARHLRAVIERDPGRIQATSRLAQELNTLGRFEEAQSVVEKAAPLAGPVPALLAPLAEAFAGQRAWPQLESLSRSWIGHDPGNVDAWRCRARAGFELGLHRIALEAQRKVLEMAPAGAEAWTLCARIAIHALDFDAATHALEQAAAIDPQHPGMLAARALLQTMLGRFEEAESSCRACIARDPGYVPVYSTLSRLGGGRLSSPDMAALELAAANEQLPPEWRISAAYALGDAHDALEHWDTAFSCYTRANAEVRARNRAEAIAYDPEKTSSLSARIIRLFPAAPPPANAPPAGAQPIFVVGMPRSGTTLVESLLAAHSRVAAGGERPAMQQIFDHFLSVAEREEKPLGNTQRLREWAEAYLRDAPALAGESYFTDKNPLNLEAAGLVAQLFPAAAIVHVRRNPLETGLSIYSHEFEKFWSFTHDLGDIGHYYGQYARLAAHWERVLGPRFITVQYEDFVADFDQAAPRLLAACGLAWEESCRDFRQSAHAIATLSAVQVRGPLRAASGRAQRYAAHLGPLREALTRAGIDLQTGALA